MKLHHDIDRVRYDRENAKQLFCSSATFLKAQAHFYIMENKQNQKSEETHFWQIDNQTC